MRLPSAVPLGRGVVEARLVLTQQVGVRFPAPQPIFSQVSYRQSVRPAENREVRVRLSGPAPQGHGVPRSTRAWHARGTGAGPVVSTRAHRIMVVRRVRNAEVRVQLPVGPPIFRVRSSAGRAPALQAGGCRFDSGRIHGGWSTRRSVKSLSLNKSGGTGREVRLLQHPPLLGRRLVARHRALNPRMGVRFPPPQPIFAGVVEE